MNLLPKLSQENEGALGKLLSANDKLGEVFILYDSYVAERDRLTNRRAADCSPQVVHRAGAGAGARSPGDAPDAGAGANPRPPSFTDLPPAYLNVASSSALSHPRPAPPPEVGACAPFSFLRSASRFLIAFCLCLCAFLAPFHSNFPFDSLRLVSLVLFCFCLFVCLFVVVF